MKTLSTSYVSFVGRLTLILFMIFVARSATAPRLISGQELAGGWPNCTNHSPADCPDVPGQECNESAIRCTGNSPSGDCDNQPPHPCVTDGDCINWPNQHCYI
jgi:hypothetical protein